MTLRGSACLCAPLRRSPHAPPRVNQKRRSVNQGLSPSRKSASGQGGRSDAARSDRSKHWPPATLLKTTPPTPWWLQPLQRARSPSGWTLTHRTCPDLRLVAAGGRQALDSQGVG